MFGAAAVTVMGMAAYRLAAQWLILLFFLVLFIIVYRVLRHRVSYFYLIFPLFLIAGYTAMLLASRESPLVQSLNGGAERECELLGEVYKVQSSRKGYRLTLRRVVLCPGAGEDDGIRKAENCIVYTGEPYERGDLLRVRGTASGFDTAKNPGEFDSRQYYRTVKVGFRVYARSVTLERANTNPVYAVASRLSDRLRSSLYGSAETEYAQVFAALLLGERDGLDGELSELFTACGIGHILAISGLHVSLIGMGLYKALRKCGAGYTASMAVGSAAILFYGVMTGNGTSTVRAIIMYIAAVYANAAGRTYDMLSAASLAAVIMLMGNPMLLYNCGFQLSFGAVLGIALIGERVRAVFDVRSKILSALITSLSVQAATMPVIMWNYYEIPVLSVPINMLVVPLMSVVMVSAVCGALAGCVNPAAGSFFIGPGVFVLRFYRLLCTFNTRLPWAVWTCGKPEPWQMWAYYGLLCAIVLLLEKYEDGRLTLGFVPAAAVIALRLNQGFEADFLYVGQGDGIFIRSGSGAAILVDGGSSDNSGLYEYTLEPFLMSKGVSRLDCAIVSHCDADHISGLRALLEKGKIKVDTLYMPDIQEPDEAYLELCELAEKSGSGVEVIYCGMKLTSGSTEITCLYPRQGGTGYDRNGNSTVLVVEDKDFSMLLTGDIGEEQEKELCGAVSEYAPFDVLKAAHHGSKYSGSYDFILAADPDSAVISCGEGNMYGHPHEEALERLRALGVLIYRTDEQGAVVFGG